MAINLIVATKSQASYGNWVVEHQELRDTKPMSIGALAVAAQVNMAKPQTVAVEYRDAANLQADGAAKATALIKYNG